MLQNKKNIEKDLNNFSEDELKLLKIYINEYKDLFQKILILTPYEFISNISKRVDITIKAKSKFNEYSKESKSKVEEYLSENFYSSDFKFSNIVKKSLENKIEKGKGFHFFEGKINEHCEEDKKDGFYIHSCGSKFYIYKYNFFNLNKNNKNNNINGRTYDYLLYCQKCDLIYKSDLIKFRCNKTNTDFYSKIIWDTPDDSQTSNDTNNDINDKQKLLQLPYATWRKYHCNAIINDVIKCQVCQNRLYYKAKSDELFCKCCNKTFNPLSLTFECVLCKEKFKSKAKAYDSLDFKNLKICVKDALVAKVKAKPQEIGCNCKYDINKVKFIHSDGCKGELLIGEINSTKIIICSKCNSIGLYNNYIWTCPQCSQKFRINNEDINDESEKYNESKINEDESNDLINEKLSINNNKNADNSAEVNLDINNNNKIQNSITNINNKVINDKEEAKNYIKKNSIFTQRKRNNNLCSDSKLKKEGLIKVTDPLKSVSLRKNHNRKVIELGGLDKNKKINFGYVSSRNIFKNNYNNKLIFLNTSLSKSKPNGVNLINHNNYMSNNNKVYALSGRQSIKKYNNLNIQKLNPQQNRPLNVGKKLNFDDVKYSQKIKDLKEEEKSETKIKFSKEPTLIKQNSVQCLNRNFSCSSKKNAIQKFIVGRSPYNEKLENNYDPYNKSQIYKSNIIITNRENSRIRILNEKQRFKQRKVIANDRYDIDKTNNQIITSASISCCSNLKQNIISNKIEHENFCVKPDIDSSNSSNILRQIKSQQNIHEKNNLDLSAQYNNQEPLSTITDISQNTCRNMFKDLQIIKQIGQGSFGKIYMVRSVSKRLYALKKLIACSEKDSKSLQNEYQIIIETQKTRREIDLVKIYGIQTKKLDSTTFCMYVLMELASTDWEKEILARQKAHFYYTEDELFRIFSQLIKTLSQLQRLNICHRDIKPQNILVFSENKLYKIADFGEAKELYEDVGPTNRQTLRGTELYMSPILFFSLRSRNHIKYVKHNPFKSDVFSFGLCALFAATLCFESLYDIRELKNSYAIKIIVENYLMKRYSQKLINFILKTLEVCEEFRPDFLNLEKDLEYLGINKEEK